MNSRRTIRTEGKNHPDLNTATLLAVRDVMDEASLVELKGAKVARFGWSILSSFVAVINSTSQWLSSCRI